jgi:hypothetical protein
VFEYFLYAAIIAETALAAFVFKTILRDPDLARFNFYFGVFYAGFLAWSIWQLNKVHHRRKLPEGQPAADPVPEQAAKPMLGLTAAQLAIIAAVFVTAVATFSWGLRLLR